MVMTLAYLVNRNKISSRTGLYNFVKKFYRRCVKYFSIVPRQLRPVERVL